MHDPHPALFSAIDTCITDIDSLCPRQLQEYLVPPSPLLHALSRASQHHPPSKQRYQIPDRFRQRSVFISTEHQDVHQQLRPEHPRRLPFRVSIPYIQYEVPAQADFNINIRMKAHCDLQDASRSGNKS